MTNFLVTPRNTPTRSAERISYDRAAAYAILDEALLCHLGFVVDGEPRVLPTTHVRVGDTLYLHASSGGGPALALRAGAERICVEVTVLDGLVFGRSQFHHSANYRSVVAHGAPRLVTGGAEQRAALAALVDKAGAVAARPGGTGVPGPDPATAPTACPPAPTDPAPTDPAALDSPTPRSRRSGRTGGPGG